MHPEPSITTSAGEGGESVTVEMAVMRPFSRMMVPSEEMTSVPLKMRTL